MLALLRLLQDGHFHSGTALGAALGVSRSAVWKQLQLLEEDLGLAIHKVRGRGYRLASPISMLDVERLQAACADAGWKLFCFDRIDSTNAEALRRLSADAPPFLVTAEGQSAGRGRRGRDWVSPFAENLYCSLALRLDGGARQLEGLSLVVGLAVLRALQDVGLSDIGVKWPNDLLAAGKKITGILLELSGDPADVCYVVIGVGINTNMQAVAQEIGQPWTSVRLESGVLCDRTTLALRLVARLGEYLERHRTQGFSALRGEWEANHLWQGERVVLASGVQHVEGVVLGVDHQGALRLQTSAGEQCYSGGELSLRLHNDS
ncbi:bifunctional biotin--[acetyl-CoA-carboxylase] ligase/biotin operon repressor BirA [Zestomonas carbonaria]|uniref:Bifunctional ligase/repressor BirA n=1 Tax=Zestomonas carbonaria TaxID=2762745 RepID=A0A7U7EQD3_9GAMM|nr:bifunctional biotin--[acetyl-CoA-carboxylase] ligase/biotin operon repressor BirA [Pseudomonas carbonaria]CAD5108853.1 Bifunctional ligase/repressor BirA [Pseudomonas carbonaria]